MDIFTNAFIRPGQGCSSSSTSGGSSTNTPVTYMKGNAVKILLVNSVYEFNLKMLTPEWC